MPGNGKKEFKGTSTKQHFNLTDMRQELELIQKIEQYLQGTLSGDERIVFEKEIAGNLQLQEDVELQKQLMKGMKRAVWRQDAEKAFLKYTFMQKLLKWSYIGASVALVTAGICYLLLMDSGPRNKNNTITKYTNDSSLTVQADTENIYNILNGNTFVINASRDTVVTTTEGTLIEIPKELFTDSVASAGKDSSKIAKTDDQNAKAKIYTLHFYKPTYKDSLTKWKEAINEKKYSKALRSLVASANPKNYLKTSAKEQELSSAKRDTSYNSGGDSIYKAVVGLNIEKIKSNISSATDKHLYKLKGKIPFLNKNSKNKNTILVFDVDNKNKTSIDTAIVIEVADKLKDKAITTKKEK